MPSSVDFSAAGFETIDTTSGIESLGPFNGKADFIRLFTAQNVRFTREGGVRTRNGFQLKKDLELDAAVDDMETHPMFDALFAKCATRIQHSLDGETFYGIGITQTASEKTFLFPFRKDIYAINLTDNAVRAAISTVESVNVAGGTLNLRVGDGSNFTNAVFYVHGIQITPSGLSGDQFTGCTGLTSAIQVGDIVTQTSTPSNFPKGSCMAELEGSAVVGGVSANPMTLYWSEPSSPAEPELFYTFPATYVKTMPSPITALKAGNSVLLIGLKRGIQYSPGFDETTGVLITIPLSDSQGIPNARCIVKMDDEFAILTNEGRVLLVAQTDAGFKIIQNVDDPRQDIDYPVQGYIQRNIDRESLSENFLHYDPGTRELSATIRMKTGITREFVLQRDIRAWSIDTGKNFRCKSIFLGRTFAGDDSDSNIHLDGEGWTDNDIPINVRITTGIMRAARKGITMDFFEHHFGGLLNATGAFYMRVVLDGEIVENKQYRASPTPNDNDDSLLELMLMEVDTGISIGGGQTGAEQIGTGGQVADAFRFDVPYEFGGEAEQAQIEFETTDEATILELRHFSLIGETEAESLLTHT